MLFMFHRRGFFECVILHNRTEVAGNTELQLLFRIYVRRHAVSEVEVTSRSDFWSESGFIGPDN